MTKEVCARRSSHSPDFIPVLRANKHKMCQRSSVWQSQQETIIPGGSLEKYFPSINTVKQIDDPRSVKPDSDVLNQSSTLDDLVSDILNDSAESNPSTSCTNQFTGPPIGKNFQEIPANLQTSQHASALPQRKNGTVEKNHLLGDWQRHPMNANGTTRAETTMATLTQESQNHGIFTGGSKQNVSTEYSSYADVTRGSVSTSSIPNGSQNFPLQNSHFSTQAKLPFPKHYNFNGRSALESMNTDLSTLHNSLGMGGSKTGYHFNHKFSKERKYNDMREQSVLKNGFEGVRNCGYFGGNPHFWQQNSALHQMGFDSNQLYKNGMNHGDINQSNFMYPPGFNQSSLLGPNFTSGTGNPVPGNGCRLPYQFRNSKNAPLNYRAENYFNNALLHQASGITGLPPVFHGLPDDILPDVPPDVNKLKDYVGGTLQGSLNGCYSELHNLEKERRKYEIELAQKFLGKRITSSNGIAVVPLPADPTPVDQLICDMFKEYNRIITLTSKIRGLTRDGLHANIDKTLDKWNEVIQLVEAHRKAEISHSLRKLSPESVKQLYSQGNNLIDKLVSLMTSTRQVRTALWLSTVYALHSTNHCNEEL